MKYKYIESCSTDPYRNLALEQLLFKYVEEETAILYLWQNDDAIIIGRNQDPYTECYVENFINSGGRIARRRSGGGAVYHDMGNLNFSIICAESKSRDVKYQDLVISVLQSFDILAEYNGRNDLMAGDKKFSGNAVFTDGGITCQHGTILISTNIRRMAEFLTPESRKMDRNHVSSVASRVINLSDIKEGITVNAVKWSFIEKCGREPLNTSIDEDEMNEQTSLYTDNNWVFGGVR